jgi:hypothetical protein
MSVRPQAIYQAGVAVSSEHLLAKFCNGVHHRF